MFRRTSPRYCKFAVVTFLQPLHVYKLHSNNIISILNNVLDAKMVLKTHLFIKNISLSLQKLRQYNKNLTKYQTKKINTAINTD